MKSPLVCVTAMVLMVLGLTWGAAQEVAVVSPPGAAGSSAPAQEVAGFDFSGNTVVSNQALEEALEAYRGQVLTDQLLSEMETRVVGLYFGHGYIARARVAQQGDKVAVKITESKANVVVEDPKAYSESFVKSHFSHMAKGPWRMKELESAMMVLRELPGLGAASVTLSEGQGDQAGLTDMKVTLGADQSETGPIVGLRIDNFGSPYASKSRVAESVWYGNLLGRGDEEQLQIVHGLNPNDLLYGDLRLTVPLLGDGTRLKAYVTAGDFEVGRDLGVLNLQGNGLSFGLAGTRPIVRSRNRSITAEAGLDWSDTDFSMNLGCPGGGPNTVPMSQDRIRKVRLGGTWDQVEKAGRARDLANLYLHQGLGGLLGGTGVGDPASRLGADNSFTKLTLDAARLQRLNDRMILSVRLASQFSVGSLLTAEQMSIGGADSVRGYPQSQELGDQGIQANVELRYTPPGLTSEQKGISWLHDLVVIGFVDHGSIFRSDPQPGEDKSDSLTGAGVGFRAGLGSANASNRFLLRCDLGCAVGGEPSSGGRVQPYLRLERQFRF